MKNLDKLNWVLGPTPCPNCADPMTEMNGGIYECHNCGMKSELGRTIHAKHTRWSVRSDDPNISVLEAWAGGIELDARDKDEHNLVADEIRYHHETTTVLIRKDIDIITVIDYRTARDGIQRAVIKAMINTETNSITIAQALNTAGINEETFREIARETRSDQSDRFRSETGTITPGRIVL